MADSVLQSQLKFSQGFIKSPHHKYDDLVPQPIESKPPGAVRTIRLGSMQAVTSAGGAPDVVFRIPATNTLITDMAFEITLGAPGGGTYVTGVGLALPKHVIIRHADRILHDYEYRDNVQHLFSVVPNERKTRFIEAAGGTTPGAEVVYAPVFAFWTSWKHEPNELSTPFPLCVSMSPLDIVLTIDTVANILAAGGSGGSITSINLLYSTILVTPDEVEKIRQDVSSNGYSRFGLDVQSGGVATIATATATDYELTGMTGSIKEVCMVNRLASDVTTAHNYFINKEITAYVLTLDGQEVDRLTNGINETTIKALMFNQAKNGWDSTNGLLQKINYSRDSDAHSWAGDLNSRFFNKMTLNVTHALGANASFNVFCVFHRIYVFRDGLFERLIQGRG